jgi:hypothetical protein
MNDLTPLHELAAIINREGTGKSWYTYAKPYVQAMYSLETAKDNYGFDTGDSIVMYALSNLEYWRGDTAREVKAQLKAHLK